MPRPRKRTPARKRVAEPNRGTSRSRKGEWNARPGKASGKPMDVTLPLVVVFVALTVGAAAWYILPDFSEQPGLASQAPAVEKRAIPAPVRDQAGALVGRGTDMAGARPQPMQQPKPQAVPEPVLTEPPVIDEEAVEIGTVQADGVLTAQEETVSEPEPGALIEEEPPVQIAKAGIVMPQAPVALVVPPTPDPVVTAEPEIARALPLDPNALTQERIAAYQVALERLHFSCGFVDGDIGMRTRRVLRAFQESRGLPVTGDLDAATRAAIGEPGEPFTTYTVTEKDMAKVVPTPKLWRDKSQAEVLGYDDAWEMLAEKFHCTRGYIIALNGDVASVAAGTQVIGPKVFPAAKIPKAASVRITLSETTMQALDANGRIVAHFPCSIARNKNKRPKGKLTVKNVVPNPNYTFSPDVLTSVAEAEGITKRMIIPPGPNNPVCTAWMGLSLSGYGMHGSPDPEAISRTQSSGCFRLANWNANKMLKLVKVGMPVYVVPPAEAVTEAVTMTETVAETEAR